MSIENTLKSFMSLKIDLLGQHSSKAALQAVSPEGPAPKMATSAVRKRFDKFIMLESLRDSGYCVFCCHAFSIKLAMCSWTKPFAAKKIKEVMSVWLECALTMKSKL